MRALNLTVAAGAALALLAACGSGDPAGITRNGPPLPGSAPRGDCSNLPDSDALRQLLRQAPQQIEAGGMAAGQFEWGAIVDRHGRVCALAVSTDDPSAAWPGSRAIALAKAFTANAFSSDTSPLSTARMYTLGQPGQSLYGLAQTNPFDAACMGGPDAEAPLGRICGGVVPFGGGLPLYREDKRIGGLGVSGDTACADHEIARTIRSLAGLDPSKGANVDDIQYSSVDGPSEFTHPLCPNTWRNGMKIGEAAPASGY